MYIRQEPGRIVLSSSASMDPEMPVGGIYYELFGEGTNLAHFAPKLREIDDDTRRLLATVASRVRLVDGLTPWTGGTPLPQPPSVQLYLLCTCVDSLANPAWLPFNDWLCTRKRKGDIEARNDYLAEWIGEANLVCSVNDLVKRIDGLYTLYLEQHGVRRRFGAFFLGLPVEVRSFIADSYTILHKGQLFTDSVLRQAWLDRPVNERLLEIAGYLYEYRRNDFTHSSRVYPTTGFYHYATPEEALADTPGSRQRARVLWFHRDDDRDKDAVLTLLVTEDEVFLLRRCYSLPLSGPLGAGQRSTLPLRAHA